MYSLIHDKLYQVFKLTYVRRHTSHLGIDLTFNTISVVWIINRYLKICPLLIHQCFYRICFISNCKIVGYQEENAKQHSCSWFHCKMKCLMHVIKLTGHLGTSQGYFQAVLAGRQAEVECYVNPPQKNLARFWLSHGYLYQHPITSQLNTVL